MAGLYLHIPFCTQACVYCNFHFSTNTGRLNEIHKALLRELRTRAQEVQEPIESVYFGGGTPSLLSGSQIEELLQTINLNYKLLNPEITLEANPENLGMAYLKDLKQAGINRLSIGVQSFQDQALKFMNRQHSEIDSLECIANASKVGFKDLSIDLIYGLPEAFERPFSEELLRALALPINHLSAYALTVEPKTALHHNIQKGKSKPLSENRAVEDFESLSELLLSHNWEHYEVSNACRDGNYSKHNSSYWLGTHYLGFGPSAHSFDGKRRRWNIANNSAYLRAFEEPKNPEGYFEEEVLGEKEVFNELVLCGLRTQWGLDLNKAKNQSDPSHWRQFERTMEEYLAKQFVIKKTGRMILTPTGRLLADQIMSNLFWVD